VKLAPRAPEFVGRTRELADLCQRLRSGQSVGLSALIAGMGGIFPTESELVNVKLTYCQTI